MTTPRTLAWLALLLTLALPSRAADPAAGRALAESVCAACHGAQGVSVADRFPNLAGQRQRYLADQLTAFRNGARTSDVMNALAAQLTDDDVANLAAHFSAQPGAAPGARSPLLESVVATRVTLPASFGAGHVRYLTKSDVESKVVAVYYASRVAIDAAAAGRPLPDGSEIFIEVSSAKLDAAGVPLKDAAGELVPDKVMSYTAMARQSGWGDRLPPLLRNENWNYALFGADRSLRTGVNQAECLACHKPKQAQNYLFLHAELAAAARKR